MGNNTPLVSILVLCYNQEHTIAQTLDSLLSQVTDFDVEILIGDDQSSDNTREICLSYLDKYPGKIRLYPESENVGFLENYKRLVLSAEGSLIACCAGDDYWSDALKLEKQVAYLTSHPECGMVHSSFTILHVEADKMEPLELNLPSGKVFSRLLQNNFIGALTTLYKKELVVSAINEGLYDRGFMMEDYPLWLFIAERSEIGFIEDDTAVWRKNEESLSNSKNKKKHIMFAASVIDVKTFFAERNHMLLEAQHRIVADLKGLLYMAFISKEEEMAALILKKLRGFNSVSFKDQLLRLGTKYSILRRLILRK